MRQDAIDRGLPAPDEEAARKQCLRPGVKAPDLADVKDFIPITATSAFNGSLATKSG